MKKLVTYGNEYAKRSSWKDFALVKLCLFSLGTIFGMSIPKERKKSALPIAFLGFAFSYIILMRKFVSVVEKVNMER